MEKQNVTITLSTELVRKARHLAVDKGMSLSAYLASLLEERVKRSEEYEAAKKAELERLRVGIDLGTHGKITWTRDELHER